MRFARCGDEHQASRGAGPVLQRRPSLPGSTGSEGDRYRQQADGRAVAERVERRIGHSESGENALCVDAQFRCKVLCSRKRDPQPRGKA